MKSCEGRVSRAADMNNNILRTRDTERITESKTLREALFMTHCQSQAGPGRRRRRRRWGRVSKQGIIIVRLDVGHPRRAALEQNRYGIYQKLLVRTEIRTPFTLKRMPR